MSALPAYTKDYFSLVNFPIPSGSSTTTVSNSFIWCLKAFLMNQLSGSGTLNGTRQASSVWRCLGSSDGVSASMTDQSDRWGSTFDNNKIRRNANGASHSWILLLNQTFGYELLIDCNSTTNSTFRISASRSGTFQSGTITSGPQALNDEFTLGLTTTGNTSAVAIIGDTTANAQHFCHFTTEPSGSFYFFFSKAGTGFFHGMGGLFRSDNANVLDTRNVFFIGATGINSTPGTPSQLVLQSPLCWSSRGTTNALVTAGGGSAPSAGGAFHQAQITAYSDAITGEIYFFPIDMWTFAPTFAKRGNAPDLYHIAGSQPGVSLPTVVAQKFICTGQLVVPLTGTVPYL